MRDADLALGHGQARQTIAHEQNMQAAAAKRVGDGQRQLGGTDAHEGRIIAGGHHDHRLLQAGAEAIFDKGFDFTAALANQGDDVDLRIGPLGDFTEQRAFADAAAGENADALATPQGQETIDGTHIGGKDLAHARAPQRRRSGQGESAPTTAIQGALVVDRSADAVEHAPHKACAAGNLHAMTAIDNRHVRLHLVAVLIQEQIRQIAGKADHLGETTAPMTSQNLAAIVHGGGNLAGQHQTAQLTTLPPTRIGS